MLSARLISFYDNSDTSRLPKPVFLSILRGSFVRFEKLFKILIDLLIGMNSSPGFRCDSIMFESFDYFLTILFFLNPEDLAADGVVFLSFEKKFSDAPYVIRGPIFISLKSRELLFRLAIKVSISDIMD